MIWQGQKCCVLGRGQFYCVSWMWCLAHLTILDSTYTDGFTFWDCKELAILQQLRNMSENLSGNEEAESSTHFLRHNAIWKLMFLLVTIMSTKECNCKIVDPKKGTKSIKIKDILRQSIYQGTRMIDCRFSLGFLINYILLYNKTIFLTSCKIDLCTTMFCQYTTVNDKRNALRRTICMLLFLYVS